ADRGWECGILTALTPKEALKRAPYTADWKRYLQLDYNPDPSERREGEIQRPGYGPYFHYGVRNEKTSDDKIIESAAEIIRSRSKTGEPWCQYIGPIGPHDPYFVPQKYLDMYDPADIELPESYTDRMDDKPALYRRTRDRFDQLSDEEHREAIRHYLAYCT